MVNNHGDRKWLEGVPQPYLGDLLSMVINHLLTGMILQETLGKRGVSGVSGDGNGADWKA